MKFIDGIKFIFVLTGRLITFILKFTVITFKNYLLRTISIRYFFQKKVDALDENENIDIVFLWVDGNSPDFIKKKNRYLNNKNDAIIEDKAIMDYRWTNHNEILIALKSIEKFCLWVSKIHIVTDKQNPDLSSFPDEFKNKIKIVDHTEIFSSYENMLPVFNSRTIETLIWRIKDLSEKFVYFNDDMFIVKPVTKSNFFANGKPFLRGTFWPVSNLKKLSMHREGMLNSARILNFNKLSFFIADHGPYTMLKSECINLFEENKAHFEKNISYKFRDRAQFKIVALLQHKLILENKFQLLIKKDCLHLSEAICSNYTEKKLRKKLNKIKNGHYKFVCINDMGSLMKTVPDILNYLPLEITQNFK